MIAKILQIISALVAIIVGDRANVKALQEQIAERDKTIQDLLAAHAADDADDASLEAAAAAATAAKEESDAKLVALNAEIEAASVKADEAFGVITNAAEIPVAVTRDGVVTQQ